VWERESPAVRIEPPMKWAHHPNLRKRPRTPATGPRRLRLPFTVGRMTADHGQVARRVSVSSPRSWQQSGTGWTISIARHR
jgi:hypothetical protein